MTILVRAIVLLLTTIALTVSAEAQTATVQGKTLDAKNVPLPGIHLRLVDQTDTSKTYRTTSGTDGSFVFTDLPLRRFQLEATAVGRQKVVQSIAITSSTSFVRTIIMEDAPIVMGDVVTQGRVPPATQNGDTTEYTAAAFKTNRDATAEDLITKMPGVTVTNGTVTAGGETVQRVLVDGKPYYGDDPTLALRNLPAEVIDRIQVFDQMSDQAQFTGFDDGQSVKSMNILTRQNRRDMQFGKVLAGYGDDQRYEAGGNINEFDGNRRISFLGSSNNVNEQNFTTQDLLGVVSSNSQVRSPGQGPSRNGGGRSRNSQFSPTGGGRPNNSLVGQQQGINTSHMFGTNLSDSLATGLFTQGSYFFNRVDNTNQQDLARQYLLGGGVTSNYDQAAAIDSRNFNNRVNARVDYRSDTSNQLTVLPQLYFQSNDAANATSGTTYQGTTTTMAQSITGVDNAGYDLSGHVVYRHRFDIPGRTVSVDAGIASTKKQSTGSNASSNLTTGGLTSQGDTLDQQTHTLGRGRTLSANIVYTEPGWENGLVQVFFNPTYTENSADKKTYDFDPALQSFAQLDLPLSNSYTNTYTTENSGIGYRWRTEGINFMGSIGYQVARLNGDMSLTPGVTTARTFDAFLPNALLLYTMPEHRSLRIFYRTSMQSPTVAQLQHVIDNSNPLLLSEGNPDLRPSYTQSFVARYGQTTPGQGQAMFLLLSATYTAHYVATSTILPSRDTTLADGTAIAQGSQLVLPVNLSGYWNVRSFFTYGVPVDWIGSMLNLNTGLTYAQTPGLINAALNHSHTYSLSQGFVIASTVSQDFDFTISYTGNYTLARNTLQSDANSNSYSHTASIKWTWTFLEGVVLRNEVNNALTAGLAAGYNQSIVLWNISLAKKVFENQNGEIKVGVADLLKQNKSLNRTVTSSYIEDSNNEALGRYVMAGFTYTFR
jgi:hypothetical protein